MTAIKPTAGKIADFRSVNVPGGVIIKQPRLLAVHTKMSNICHNAFQTLHRQHGETGNFADALADFFHLIDEVNKELDNNALELVALTPKELQIMDLLDSASERIHKEVFHLLEVAKGIKNDPGQIRVAINDFRMGILADIASWRGRISVIRSEPDHGIDVDPAFSAQFETAASNVEKIVKGLGALPLANQVMFQRELDVVVGLLRRVAHELYKQDQIIESSGKSYDKLVARVTELSMVRAPQEWAALMSEFSKLVARDKEVGAGSAPIMEGVMAEVMKGQQRIVELETRIEELQARRQHETRVLSDEGSLTKRIERFERGLQTMFNSMQSSQKNDMAVPPRGVTKAKNTLTQSCLLVRDLMDLLKVRGDKLVALTENAMRETEILSAAQVECGELKARNHELNELVKCTESYLETAQVKINAMADAAVAKDEELVTLRTNYAECLGRLFKARVMRPDELYSKGALFLPQVTGTPENDGFYEVNPEWHGKVVKDLELDLKDPGHRRTYERVLIASAARLHNNNYPVADGGKQEITVVVAWDAYLSVDHKSPTFSTGKLPLFRRPENNTNEWLDLVLSLGNKSGIEINDRDVGLDAVTEQVVSGTTVGRKQTGTEEEPKASASHGDPEPTIFAKAQPHMHLGAFTLSEEFIVWYNVNVGLVDNDMNELQARNDFRTYLGDKIAKFLTLEATPLVVIDWDAAAITGFINFLCPELSKVNRLIMNQIADGLPVMFQGAYL